MREVLLTTAGGVGVLAPAGPLLILLHLGGGEIPHFCSPMAFPHPVARVPQYRWAVVCTSWLFTSSSLTPTQCRGGGASCYCWVGWKSIFPMWSPLTPQRRGGAWREGSLLSCDERLGSPLRCLTLSQQGSCLPCSRMARVESMLSTWPCWWGWEWIQ